MPFDSNVYMDDFFQLNIEYMTWVFEQLNENYRLDSLSMLGQTVPEIVKASMEPFLALKPPDGVVLLLLVDGGVAGMGAVKRLGVDVGEIKRMYIRPRYRGGGYGKRMLNRLMEAGGKFGYASFMLDTPKFSHTAHHIYRSAGFDEIDEYPESEIPTVIRPYWMFMEKRG